MYKDDSQIIILFSTRLCVLETLGWSVSRHNRCWLKDHVHQSLLDVACYFNRHHGLFVSYRRARYIFDTGFKVQLNRIVPGMISEVLVQLLRGAKYNLWPL